MDVPIKPEITLEVTGDRLSIHADVDLEGLLKLRRMLEMLDPVLTPSPSQTPFQHSDKE